MTKILVITSHYLPGYKAGGTVRSLANIIEWLGDELEFYVVTADRDLGDIRPYPGVKPRTWQSVGKAHVLYLSPGEMGFLSLRHLLRTFSYDLLYLNSFFAPLTRKVLLLRRLKQIPQKPVVLAPRGEFSPGAFLIKHLKKRLYVPFAKHIGLYDNILWQASNGQEKENIICFLGHQINNKPLLVHVASNLPSKLIASQVMCKPKLAKHLNSAHIIFLSRISPKKNLHLALELLVTISGHVRFDIYGPIQDHRYWVKCQSLMRKLPPNVKAIYKGVVPQNEVFDLFSHYHLFFFLTRGENFGHVILEALSAGCPVLTTDQTPWLNLVENKAGWNVSLEEPEQSSTVLKELISMDDNTFRVLSKSTKQYANRVVNDSTVVEANRQMFLRALGN